LRFEYPFALGKRVVILGPGASGKSTLAVRLREITGLPVIELDKIFWQPGLVATPRDQWTDVQRALVQKEAWIMDGDLGPYDAVETRLRAADTIVFLDPSLMRSVWRALRRSREQMDFWIWLLFYRYRSRPLVRRMIAEQAPNARVHVLRSPSDVDQFLRDVERGRAMKSKLFHP
jgi:adenylate kinase family enzyme